MKILKALFLLPIFGITYLSCSSDDDNINKKSGFTLKSKFYSTSKEYVLKALDTSYPWEKIYISNAKLLDSIYYGSDCNYSYKLKQDVLIYLLDTDIKELPDGNYNYTINVLEPTNEISKVRIRYEMEVDNTCLRHGYKIFRDTHEFLTGNITISKSGNIFDIEYSFGVEDEIYLKGIYEGELESVTAEKYFFL